MTKLNRSSTVWIPLLMGSCVLKPLPGSKSLHAPGTTLTSPAGAQWHETSAAQYAELIAPGNIALTCITASCFLDEGHPLVRRLQAWTDTLHVRLRAARPELAAAPAPRVLISKEEAPFGFTETIATCLPVGVRFAESSGTESFTDGAVGIVKGKVQDVSSCVPGDAAVSSLAASLELIERFASPCKVTLDSTGVVISRGCARNKYFEKFNTAKSFATVRVSNLILLSKGMLKLAGGEEEALFVLMHEVAHFYRAHPIHPDQNFTVYYRDRPQAALQRPIEDAAMRALAEEIRALQADRQAPDRAARLAALEKRMADENLGYYSFEQEADEMALEFLTTVGVSPEKGKDSLLKVLAAKENPQGVSHATCSAWIASGWRDGAGTPLRVPLGNLADPHHEFCYRIFNVSREIEAHAYTPGQRPDLPPLDWNLATSRL